MKKLKLNIHSIVDLITNSSTVLYTDSRKSVEALENVIKEMFKLYNIDKEVNDVFDIYIEVDDIESKVYDYIYDYHEEFNLNYEDDDFRDRVDELATEYCEGVESGKIERPDWMSGLVDDHGSNWISVRAKEKEYEKLASLLKSLIYSTDVEEGWE